MCFSYPLATFAIPSYITHLLTLIAENMFQETTSVSAPLRPAQDTTKMPPPPQNILLASREGKESNIFRR